MDRTNTRLRVRSAGYHVRAPKIGLLVSAPDGGATVVDEVRGVRTIPSHGLPTLDGGVWVTNLKPSDVCAAPVSSPDAKVLADGWIGLSWDNLLEEWGFASSASALAAGRLHRIFGRVVSLSLRAVMKPSNLAFENRDIALELVSGSSLAAGIDRVAGAARPLGALNSSVAEVMRDLHLCGIWNPQPRSRRERGELTLRTYHPRVGYAWAISRKALPDGAQWFRVGGGEPAETLSVNMMSELEKLDRPVVVKGVFQRNAAPVPSWLRCWFAGSSGIYGRTCLTLEEAGLVRPFGRFLVREVYAGSRWARSDNDSGLRGRLVRLLKACGGSRPAELSWSAGLAAKNFLLVGLHQPFGRDVPHEPGWAWLAAHDRIAMIPVIEAIDSAGGRVVSAHAGSVGFQIRKDADAISSLAASLWRLGYLFPMSQANRLRQLGAAIPIDGNEYAANGNQRTLAVAIHRCRRGPLWHLDSVMDAPVRERSSRSRPAALAVEAA